MREAPSRTRPKLVYTRLVESDARSANATKSLGIQNAVVDCVLPGLRFDLFFLTLSQERGVYVVVLVSVLVCHEALPVAALADTTKSLREPETPSLGQLTSRVVLLDIAEALAVRETLGHDQTAFGEY